MYDTVTMKLSVHESGGVSFLEETSQYLEDISTYERRGVFGLVGKVGGLTVSLDEGAARVTKGSLCKWHLGDNVQELDRTETRRAVERLSDTLHLPMERAAVTRFDVGHNLFMQYPPEVYFRHLGELRYSRRLEEPSGVYYKQGSGRLVFYDKAREARAAGGYVPEVCRTEHILRYERRFSNRLSHYLQVPRVTAADLGEEGFYCRAGGLWLQSYNAIRKINLITINPETMRSRKEFDKAARLALVEKVGGEAAMLEQIREMQARGDITKKQAYDMRKAVKEACISGKGLTVQSDVITELDMKIAEAAGL